MLLGCIGSEDLECVLSGCGSCGIVFHLCYLAVLLDGPYSICIPDEPFRPELKRSLLVFEDLHHQQVHGFASFPHDDGLPGNPKFVGGFPLALLFEEPLFGNLQIHRVQSFAMGLHQ